MDIRYNIVSIKIQRSVLWTQRVLPKKDGMMDRIRIEAPAKINLALDVVRRREDGYHEVRMIMQTIGIYDYLTFEKKEEPNIEVLTNLTELPGDDSNLIYKAARLILEKFGMSNTHGVRITLDKRIPIAAGMAGGSTDAAATFKGMNELFQLDMSLEEMMHMGVRIGADVPYCILGGTALAEGIGEILTPLPQVPDCVVLVAKLNFSVSTKFVYENLHADEIKIHPDVDSMIQAITNRDIRKISDFMGNVLERVTIAEYPVIEDVKTIMKEQGAYHALMSGSGPTVFGLFRRHEEAQGAAERLKEMGLTSQTFVTGFTHR